MSELAEKLEELIQPYSLDTGDYAVVTGDEAGMGHHFAVGTQVSLSRSDPSSATKYGNHILSWLCMPLNGADDRAWWVAPEDLAPLLPTEEEVQEAIQSIRGVPGAV